MLESGLVEEGTTWDGDDTQRKLKSAIAARVEHALLNDRRPSPVTHPVIVSKDAVAEGEPFSLEASFFCCPVAELSSYDPIEVAWKRPVVSDEEVERQLFRGHQERRRRRRRRKAPGGERRHGGRVHAGHLRGARVPRLDGEEQAVRFGPGFHAQGVRRRAFGL